jgi:demethylmenaquinone methyltransferase/2-methoxy-6-polyprenyl-1,4-benzoquinol methylase
MNKKDIVDFFDRFAPGWDADLIHDDEKINAILHYAGITSGVTVLDVACGTGVLIPDYLARDVKKVTAVDISPAMIKIARAKFQEKSTHGEKTRLEFINADIETAHIPDVFDRCVVYNSFPHFPSPQNLIRVLAGKLTEGGRLTIAHSMSREKINAHHGGEASKVSIGLMDANELSALLQEYFDVTTVISNENMYVVSGVKRTR